jgi:hypothetical protein
MFFSDMYEIQWKNRNMRGPCPRSIPELPDSGPQTVPKQSTIRIQNLKTLGWKMVKKYGTDR